MTLKYLKLSIISLLVTIFFVACNGTTNSKQENTQKDSDKGKPPATSTTKPPANSTSQTQSNNKANLIKVIATTSILADTVKNLVNSNYEVESLMKVGVDPHLFKPTRTDIVKLMSADIVIANGLFLEGKLLGALTRIKNKGTTLISVGDTLEEEDLLSSEAFNGHPDPHIWMDPILWSKVVPTITNCLIKYTPENSSELKAASKTYLRKLARLHDENISQIGEIPKENRYLVTAHDAFSYYGKRYNIKVRGIQGISTESEAGIADIEKLVTLITTNKIPAIFVESTVSKKNINALIEGAKAKGHEVEIGGTLFSDSLGTSNTGANTYIKMIESNTNTIHFSLKKKL